MKSVYEIFCASIFQFRGNRKASEKLQRCPESCNEIKTKFGASISAFLLLARLRSLQKVPLFFPSDRLIESGKKKFLHEDVLFFPPNVRFLTHVMNIWTRRYKKVQGNWQFLEAHQKVTCPILASFSSSTWYFSFIPSFQLSPIYTFPTGKVVARRMSWTESNEIVSPRSSKDHLLYLIKPKVLFLPWFLGDVIWSKLFGQVLGSRDLKFATAKEAEQIKSSCIYYSSSASGQFQLLQQITQLVMDEDTCVCSLARPTTTAEPHARSRWNNSFWQGILIAVPLIILKLCGESGMERPSKGNYRSYWRSLLYAVMRDIDRRQSCVTLWEAWPALISHPSMIEANSVV